MNIVLILFLIFPIVLASQSTEQQRQAPLKDSKPIEFVDITKSAGINWPITTLAAGFENLIDTMRGGGLRFRAGGGLQPSRLQQRIGLSP